MAAAAEGIAIRFCGGTMAAIGAGGVDAGAVEREVRACAAAEAEEGAASGLRASVKVARAQKRSCAERREVSCGRRRVPRMKLYRLSSTVGGVTLG